MPPENIKTTNVTDTEEKVKCNVDKVEIKDMPLEKMENIETMSKRQRKKLIKQKQWEEQRVLRKYGFFLIKRMGFVIRHFWADLFYCSPVSSMKKFRTKPEDYMSSSCPFLCFLYTGEE